MIKRAKKPTDVFKPLRKGDRVTHAYLYNDRHAIVGFQRYDRDTGKRATYYKQIDSIGFSCQFSGRIVFSDCGGGVSWLRAMIAADCSAMHASAPNLENGSYTSRAKGQLIGFVSADTAYGSIYEYDFPGLLSGGTTFQEGENETFDSRKATYGGETPIAETLLLITPPCAEYMGERCGFHTRYPGEASHPCKEVALEPAGA